MENQITITEDSMVFSALYENYEMNIKNDNYEKKLGIWSIEESYRKNLKYAYVYLTDCGGRVTKLQNMTNGAGGATGALEVTTGTLGFAKIAAPKVLNLAWKEMGEEDWKQIPFRFIVSAKDPKGKKLVGAFVRLTVCATLDADNDGEADDDLTRCSYVSLGKTNGSGTLIKQIHASQIATIGKKPDWADEPLNDEDYWDDNYLSVWESWVSVLKTKTTTYTEYSKTINLYDSIDDEGD